jgi:hypothetical protein
MKNLATVLTIMSMVIMPCLVVAQNDTDCVTETKALLDTNQAVKAAYAELQTVLEADLKKDPTAYCNILGGKCDINIGAHSANLTSTCVAEGGQLVEKDLVATCSGKVQNIPIPDGFTVNVFKAPLCAGASCDPDDLPSEIENQIPDIVDDVVKEIEAAVGGTLMCDVEVVGEGNSTSLPTSGVQAAAALTTAAGVTFLSFIVM